MSEIETRSVILTFVLAFHTNEVAQVNFVISAYSYVIRRLCFNIRGYIELNKMEAVMYGKDLEGTYFSIRLKRLRKTTKEPQDSP
jgi:hypothetical protein